MDILCVLHVLAAAFYVAVQDVVYFVAVTFNMAYRCCSSFVAISFDMRSVSVQDVLVAFSMRVAAVDDVLPAFDVVKPLKRPASDAFGMSVLHERRDLVAGFWPCRAIEAVVVFVFQAFVPDL